MGATATGKTDNLLSVTQCAAQLRVTRQAVLKAIAQERLQAVRVGHVWAVPRQELRRFTKESGRR